MSRVRVMTMLTAALLACAAVPASAQDIASLAWLSGTWEETRLQAPHVGTWTEERWTPPRGGVMLGVSLSGRTITDGPPSDDATAFEFMRIAQDAGGTIRFYGSPNGAPAVAFRLVRSAANEAVFDNPAHDYPQRITYRREGDSLIATISLIDGSRAMRWTYQRR